MYGEDKNGNGEHHNGNGNGNGNGKPLSNGFGPRFSLKNGASPARPASPGIQHAKGKPETDVVAMLWRWRWTILAFLALGTASALTYVYRATPIYESHARLYIEREGPRLMSDVREALMGSSTNYLYTQAELARSQPVLEGLLKRIDPPMFQTFEDVDNPMAALRQELRVSVGRKDELLTFAYRSPYAEEAASIVNAAVEAFIDFHEDQRKHTSTELLTIMTTERDKRQEELDKRFRAMMDYKITNGSLALESKEGNIEFALLEKINEKLAEVRLSEMEADAAMRTISRIVESEERSPPGLMYGVNGTPASETWQRERVASLALLHQLQRERAKLQSELRGEHPALHRIDKDVELIRSQIDEFDHEYLQSQLVAARYRHQSLREHRIQLESDFSDQRQEVLKLNSQQALFDVLEYEWKQTQKQVTMLEDRIKEIDVNNTAGVMNISLLDSAKAEQIPVWPNRPILLLIGAMAGLMLGLGIAVTREHYDRRLRSVDEITSALPVPLYGCVPVFGKTADRCLRGHWLTHEPLSAVSEAYRTIRTAIHFGHSSRDHKVIMIGAALNGEGKSTLTSNLAIATSQTQQKTLIIDADFRLPVQHNIFGIARSCPGFASVLAGSATLDEAIHETPYDNLHIMPAGFIPPNPVELLENPRMAEILAELREKYDHIFIDSPPTMLVADARILASKSDAVILTVRPDVITPRALTETVTAIEGVGTPIAGAVINGVMRTDSEYSYRYNYVYARKNGASKKSEAPVASRVGAQEYAANSRI